jgi:hypothetical protein
MRVLGLAGVAAFTVTSALVGFRLLRLAARTHRAPELAMGLAFVLSAAVGFPLFTVALLLKQAGTAAATVHGIESTGALFTYAGYLSLAIGNWRIFRADRRWPLAAIVALATATCSVATVVVVLRDARPGQPRELTIWAGVAIGLVVFAWSSAESLLLHRRLRRRLRLGLVEPEVVNRVLLWGVGSLAAVGMTAHGLALRILLGPGDAISDGQRLVASGLGLVAAVAIGLAFFPPAAYRRRFAAPPIGSA